MAAPLAAPSDLPLAALGVDESDPIVAFALNWASGVVRAYTHQTLSYVAEDPALLTPRRAPMVGRGVQLSEFPIVSVDKLEGYFRQDDGTYSWSEIANWHQGDAGWIFSLDADPFAWPIIERGIRATYTHGFEEIPPDLVAVVGSLALNYVANPERAVEIKVGEVANRYAPANLTSVSPAAEMSILDSYAVGIVA